MSDLAALKVESEDGSVVVYLSGEIDVSNAENLATEIAGAVVGAHSIVIDLEAVQFLDSSGLRLLRQLSAGAREANANFVVVASPNSVARSVIDIVSMGDEIAVQDSLKTRD
jgi:anti-sigma B factor antagonist